MSHRSHRQTLSKDMYVERGPSAALLTQAKLQTIGISMFGHTCMYAGSQEKDGWNRNWQLTYDSEGEGKTRCLLTPKARSPCHLVWDRQTHKPGMLQGRGLISSFQTVMWCWAGPACSETNTVGFTSFLPRVPGRFRTAGLSPRHQPWPLKGRDNPCQGF